MADENNRILWSMLTPCLKCVVNFWWTAEKTNNIRFHNLDSLLCQLIFYIKQKLNQWLNDDQDHCWFWFSFLMYLILHICMIVSAVTNREHTISNEGTSVFRKLVHDKHQILHPWTPIKCLLIYFRINMVVKIRRF